MKQYHFLSGIARSGSTLLGSIMNQNPEFHVTPTCPLLDLFCQTEQSLQNLAKQYTFDIEKINLNIHSAICDGYFKDVKPPHIFIKHRGWPKNIETIKKIITPNPKVICTYRPLPEVFVSFIKLANKDPSNTLDADLKKRGLEINTKNRVVLLWNEYSNDPFYSTVFGLKHNRENIHIIKYDDIVKQPEEELKKVYSFLELPFFDGHFFNNINNTCAENDLGWGFNDLHLIRSKLEKTSDDPIEVLGEELFEQFIKIDKELSSLI